MREVPALEAALKRDDSSVITKRRLVDKILEISFNGGLALLPNRVFGRLRPPFLRLMGATVGSRVKLSRRVKVLGARNLVLEDDVAIANSVILDARGGLRIKQGALVGFESILLTHTHAWPDPSIPVHHQGSASQPITIGSNSWLGARVIVLPGGMVGESSVIGANSVVSSDIPSNSVAVGTPARIVSPREDRRLGSG